MAPGRSRPARRGGHGAFSAVRLLEVDPELGARLAEPELAQATRLAVLTAVKLAPGPWQFERLRDDPDVRGELHGFVVLSGALTTEVVIAGRACIRLLTVQDVVLTDGAAAESVPACWGWSVLEPARIAVLDDRLLVIARHWPRLLSALLERAGRQFQHALLQQAISQLPRVEDRLLALLWSIADRRGVVRPDGVWIDLPLTHETIARMVGARRPTVTLGLRTLGEHGQLRAHKGGWLLAPASLEAISPPVRAAAPTRPAATVGC